MQAEDGIRDRSPSRGLGDVYKRQPRRSRAASARPPEGSRSSTRLVRPTSQLAGRRSQSQATARSTRSSSGRPLFADMDNTVTGAPLLSQGVCLLNQQTDGSRQDTSTRRHLFVINARMETLRYDAAVIPTDARFHVEAHWEPLLGSSGSTLRSAGWGSQ